ncbi:hypothetical protein BDN67DRAFT_1015318 [Paxillus ammoniavirescens]|nr:hypothetical protein BDN67DRAFT_1015318 [Paxillus ammoniavirescens]
MFSSFFGRFSRVAQLIASTAAHGTPNGAPQPIPPPTTLTTYPTTLTPTSSHGTRKVSPSMLNGASAQNGAATDEMVQCIAPATPQTAPKRPTPRPMSMSMRNGPRGRETATKRPKAFPKAHGRAKRPHVNPTWSTPFPEASERAKRPLYGPIPSPKPTSTPNEHHHP